MADIVVQIPMFESLQENLSSALRALRGRGRLTESNMRDGMQQVQMALLEADVSLPVVKDFMARHRAGRRRNGAQGARPDQATRSTSCIRNWST